MTQPYSPSLQIGTQSQPTPLTQWRIDSHLLHLNTFDTRHHITPTTPHCPTTIHGQPMEMVESFSYLGIFLDNNLSSDHHITDIHKSCQQRLCKPQTKGSFSQTPPPAPSVASLNTSSCTVPPCSPSPTETIAHYPFHPLNTCFLLLLPSDYRYSQPQSSFGRSFVPTVIIVLNSLGKFCAECIAVLLSVYILCIICSVLYLSFYLHRLWIQILIWTGQTYHAQSKT